MEEKNKTNEEIKSKFIESTEKLKNETIETAKKIKDSINDTKIKEETKQAKGIIIDMIKNPFEKIKEVANDETGKFLRTTILLIIVWTIAVFLRATYSTIYYWGFTRVFNNILNVLKVIIAPVLGILVYSLIVLLYNNKNKKTLITVISTVTVTQMPLIISAIVSLLPIFASKLSIITVPFSKLCSSLALIFGFFGFKFLYNKECKDFIKKYLVIQVMYYVFYIIISFLEIYI